MQNFAALALLGSSLSPLAQANDDSYIDLDDSYTYTGETEKGISIKVEAKMKITGNVISDVHAGEALTEGNTIVTVGWAKFEIDYSQKYNWHHIKKHDEQWDEDYWALTEDQDVKATIYENGLYQFYTKSFEEEAAEGDNIDGEWWYTGLRQKAGFQAITNFTHKDGESFKGDSQPADPSFWVDDSAVRLQFWVQDRTTVVKDQEVYLTQYITYLDETNITNRYPGPGEGGCNYSAEYNVVVKNQVWVRGTEVATWEWTDRWVQWLERDEWCEEGGPYGIRLLENDEGTQSTDYAKTAAGATFGAIALFSIAGLIVANQKKTVREHEESLL